MVSFYTLPQHTFTYTKLSVHYIPNGLWVCNTRELTYQWFQYLIVDGWGGQNCQAWEPFDGKSSSGCLTFFAACSSPRKGSHLLPMLLILFLALPAILLGYLCTQQDILPIWCSLWLSWSLFFILQVLLFGLLFTCFPRILLVTTPGFFYSLADTLVTYLCEKLICCVWLCQYTHIYMLLATLL